MKSIRNDCKASLSASLEQLHLFAQHIKSCWQHSSTASSPQKVELSTDVFGAVTTLANSDIHMALSLCAKQNSGKGGGQGTFSSSQNRQTNRRFTSIARPAQVQCWSIPQLRACDVPTAGDTRAEMFSRLPAAQSALYLCALSLQHLPICSSGYISYRHQLTLQSQWVFSKRLSRTSLVTWRSSTISDFVLLSFMCTLTTSWEQRHRRVSTFQRQSERLAWIC